jgi:hypothetical protein
VQLALERVDAFERELATPREREPGLAMRTLIAIAHDGLPLLRGRDGSAAPSTGYTP